jgi:autotransporter translocation and assembly factor TamB
VAHRRPAAGKDQSASATLARSASASIEASRQGEQVEVTRLAVIHRGGRLDGQGRIRLDGPRAFAADLRFNGIDPSAFTDARSRA